MNDLQLIEEGFTEKTTMKYSFEIQIVHQKAQIRDVGLVYFGARPAQGHSTEWLLRGITLGSDLLEN